MWIERAYAADPDDDELEVGERKRASARESERAGRVASASRNARVRPPDPTLAPPLRRPPVLFLAARRAR